MISKNKRHERRCRWFNLLGVMEIGCLIFRFSTISIGADLQNILVRVIFETSLSHLILTWAPTYAHTSKRHLYFNFPAHLSQSCKVAEMMNIVGRGANLPSYLKATSQVVASGLKPAAVAVPVTKESATYVHPQSTVSCGLQGNVPSGWINAKSGLTGKCPAPNCDASEHLAIAA